MREIDFFLQDEYFTSFSPRLSEYREPSPLPNSISNSPSASGGSKRGSSADAPGDTGGTDPPRRPSQDRRVTITDPSGAEQQQSLSTAAGPHTTSSARILRKTR